MIKTKDLLKLFWPILIEQLLNNSIGIFNTMMVSGVGPQAISAVGVVDSINQLVMNLFVSLATGVTVVVAQYMGAENYRSAEEAASQTVSACLMVAMLSGLLLILFDRPILGFLFPNTEAAVMDNARIYMRYSGISFPFLAVFSACAGVLRACRNMKAPMVSSIIMNIVNLSVSAVAIYGFHLGVHGAGAGMLSARIVGAIMLVWVLWKVNDSLRLHSFTLKLKKAVLIPVMKIGIPAGIDAIVFSGGKLLVQTFVAGLGTAAIAANSIAGSVNSLVITPGNAFAICSATVIGNEVGSGERKILRSEMLRLILYSSLVLSVITAIFFPFTTAFLRLYMPPPDVMHMTRQITYLTLACIPFFWSISFVSPAAIRSTGDAVYVTVVSVVSMWVCRVIGGWFLTIHLHYGIMGIWIFWCIDWVVRGSFYMGRIISRKYERYMPDMDALKKEIV